MSGQDLKPLNILVFGPTGVGKSTIINLLTNNVFCLPVGDSLESCTEKMVSAWINYRGRKMVFWDTPGFDDSKVAPATHLAHLSTMLGAMYVTNPKPHIHGILFIHRITDNRMSGSALTNLRVFRSIIGKEACENLVFVTNRWSDPPSPQHERFEAELIRNDKYFGKAVKDGARAGPAFRIKENAKNSEAQQKLLDIFLGYDPIITQNQKERIDDELAPEKTSAGRVIDEQLNKLKEEKDAEIKLLREECDKLKLGDIEAREEIEEALEESRKQKENAENELKILRESHNRDIERLLAESRSGSDFGIVVPFLGQLGSALISGAMSRRG